MVPAGSSIASLPIVVKRDASLKSSRVTLALEILINSDFKLVNYNRNKVKLTFTDQLAKPKNWGIMANYCFGAYGPAKHQWLIDQTGHTWDDEFISTELGFTSSLTWNNYVNANYDGAYIDFLITKIRETFAAYNQQRLNQGLDVLREENGTAVSFNSI
ncbi:hypothetical protein D3C87_1354250 [compost metagenome]